jgi:hypothetical protein
LIDKNFSKRHTLNGIGIDSSDMRGYLWEYDFTEDEYRWLADVQQKQDSESPWGRSVEYADDGLPLDAGMVS